MSSSEQEAAAAGFGVLTRQAAELQRQLGAVAVGFGLALAGVLWFAKPGLLVIAFVVFVMGGLFGYGFRQLEGCRKHLQALAQELRAVAGRLGTEPLPVGAPPGPGSPPPASGVPAVLSELASAATVSRDMVESAVDRLVSPAADQLAQAAFLRTVLVLAGLFGTVLFFSQELKTGVVAQGDLDQLLPGLRGALASTLSGILGSITLGFASHRPRRLLHQVRGAVEVFLHGPVRRSLALHPSPGQVVTETDLWLTLVEEVRELRESAQEATARMGDDAHSYALALQEVGRRLAALPHLQLPPELTRLEESVATFREGTRELWKTVEVLVPVVRTLGVEIPAQVFARLEEVAERSEQAAQANRDAAQLLQQGVAQSQAAHRDLQTEASTLRGVAGEIRDLAREPRDDLQRRIEALSREVHSGTEAVRNEVRSGSQALHREVHAVGETLQGAEQVRREQEAALAELLEQVRSLNVPRPVDEQAASVAALMDRADQVFARLEEAHRGMEEAGTQNRRAATEVEAHVSAFREQLSELGRVGQDLSRRSAAISGIEQELAAIREWHSRMQRAPLVRMATFTLPRWPWWRRDRAIPPGTAADD